METTTTKTKKPQTINMLDIIPLTEPSTDLSADSQVLRDKYLKYVAEVNDLVRLTKSLGVKDDSLVKDYEHINKSIVDMRQKFFFKHGFLPAGMDKLPVVTVSSSYYSTGSSVSEKSDYVHKLSTSGKVSGRDIRELADKFNFIIVPYDYLDKDSYRNESYGTKRAIEAFGQKRDGVQVYVVTPIDYYSINRHIDSGINLPIYAGKHAPTITSININVPVFRSILSQMEKIRENTNTNFEQIRSSITQMQGSLNSLRREVERQAIQQAEQQLRLARLEQAEIERRTLSNTDPVMIAFAGGRTSHRRNSTR